MAKAKKSEGTKAKQVTIGGEAFKRPNRIAEIDDAAEAFRKARDKRMSATKVESEKKSQLKGLMKKHGLITSSYFYDDEDGDTEEIKPIVPDPDAFDVKVNKVKQAPAKADE